MFSPRRSPFANSSFHSPPSSSSLNVPVSMSNTPPNPALTSYHTSTPPYLRPWPLPPQPPAIHVRPRTFCCCIPVRAGTMVLSLLSAVASVSMGLEALRMLFTSLSNWWAYWAVLASCVLWCSLTLISMYGFVGAWYKKREWVEWFYELCWWHIWINVVFGIWWLFICTSASMKDLLSQLCVKAIQAADSSADVLSVDSSTLSSLSERCYKSTKLWLILLSLWWAGAILIELWLVLIVGHCLDELEDWDAAAEGFDLEGPPPYRFVSNSMGKHHSSKSSRSKSSRSSSQRSRSGRTAKSNRDHLYDAV